MLKRWKRRVLTVGWFTILLTMCLIVVALFPAWADYIYAEVYTYDPGDCETRNYVYGIGPKEPLVWTPWEVGSEPDDDICDEDFMLIGGAGYKLWITGP